MTYTVVHDATEIVTGPADEDSETLQTETGAAVVIEDGTVSAVGPSAEITAEYPPANAETAVDASGNCILPGFVDSHTHALFVGDRSDEFEAKLAGKSYQEILADGGGILRTVRNVREATDGELAAQLRTHLDVMLANGTTTAEVKSGYGLDTDIELRMLAVIDRVNENHPVGLVPTFMGAHAVPDDTTSEAYTESVVTEQLPTVADQGIAEFCDVFCEADVFSVEQSRRILTAGQEHGLTPKIHADEFARLGGSQLAAELSAASADHLLQSTPEDAASLVDNGVTPTFLPGTAFGLDGEYPRLAPFEERGTIPAIATDFNPNCYAPTLGFAATLACVGVGMTPAQAIRGITERGAAALDRTDGRGTLRTGAPGDLVVLDAPTYRHLPYKYDGALVETVLKDGTVVH
ncbi:imidazolonepropionase [Natronomonas salsuginis]|uniref:Imidazolonepropionase n=1 Tax=Natronomonas salsuginis TaxID=2217661 RepID=A0A4U5JAC8_9EURY|nr:imidazolonepropionase [Natronomonas salsuginis]TKR25211.1 imidazolonepropionase [Natronomonas salsuginis]